MKNITKNILITLAVIIIGVILIIIFIPKTNASDEGNIQIILVDSDGKTIFDDSYHYKKDDNLWNIIKTNYNQDLIYDETSEYGVRLLGIGGIKTEFEHGSYLAIYVNDKYSEYGISRIQLKDGLVLKIVEVIL